jgi:tetratricopeptide (TPR) repeat protein
VSSFADFQRLIAQTTGDPAHASVELLLLQMEPAAAKHFRLCAIPHQFDLTVFKLLMPEVELVQAEQRYQEFSRLSPVIHLTDALTLHDQARRFLFDQWLKENGTEFQVVSGRLVKHFEKSADVQNSYDSTYARRQRMFHMIGHDQSKGIEEFEKIFRDERVNGRLSECEALLALVREYDPILTQLHSGIVLYHEARLWFERRDWSHAEKLFRAVLEINGLPQSYRIKSWNRIGLLFARQRYWKDAILNLEKGVQLAKESNDLKTLPFAVHDLGTAYRDSGEPDRSRRLLQESIDLAKKVQDTSCIAAGYNSLGTLERRGGDIRRGIEHYKKSLEYLSILHDHLRTAQVYNNLGAAYADLGEWETSREMYQKSIELKTDAGDTIGLARTLSNLIPVYQHLSRLQDAISAAEKATRIFEKLRDPFSAAVATRNLAKLYRGTEAKEEVTTTYLRAIELFREAKDYDQAEATKTELDAYTRPVGMPWWALTATIFGFLAVVAVIVLFAWLLHKAE